MRRCLRMPDDELLRGLLLLAGFGVGRRGGGAAERGRVAGGEGLFRSLVHGIGSWLLASDVRLTSYRVARCSATARGTVFSIRSCAHCSIPQTTCISMESICPAASICQTEGAKRVPKRRGGPYKLQMMAEAHTSMRCQASWRKRAMSSTARATMSMTAAYQAPTTPRPAPENAPMSGSSIVS
jgi:hypothetical protein